MKLRNSIRRRRLACLALIWPVATSRAANRVVVPRALVFVGQAGQRPAIGQFEITLGSLQGLDRRLLIDREHDRVLRRIEVEADDGGGLGRELGVGGEAPRLAPGEIDPLRAQETPDVLVADVAQLPGE
jgi:hypothetical protein